MITLRNVTYKAGGTTLLNNVSVNLSDQSVAVIGCNGSGKSTLARLLNGLIVPDSGQVLIDGFDTHKSLKTIRKKVGFVFQNPDLQFVFPTVEEDLAFGLKNIGLSGFEIDKRIQTTLATYDLEHLRHHAVHSLSGGEKQLLCIAAVLIMQPNTVVFDEPTTLLDLANRELINSIISALPIRTVVVTHDLEFAEGVDQVLLIHAGELVYAGDPADAIMQYLSLVRGNR